MLINADFFKVINEDKLYKFFLEKHPEGLSINQLEDNAKNDVIAGPYVLALEFAEAEYICNLNTKTVKIIRKTKGILTIKMGLNRAEEIKIGGYKKTYRYDAAGNYEMIKLGKKVIFFKWDSAGNKIYQKTISGTEYFWEYDKNRYLVFYKIEHSDGSKYHESWVRDDRRNILVNQNQLGQIQEYKYNEKNQMIWMKSNDGSEHTYTYSENGKKRTSTLIKIGENILNKFPVEIVRFASKLTGSQTTIEV